MELNELLPAEAISVKIAAGRTAMLAASIRPLRPSERSADEYTIDAVGDRLWHYISRPTTLAELRDVISQEFAVQPERCERDIRAWLQQLADEGWLSVGFMPVL